MNTDMDADKDKDSLEDKSLKKATDLEPKYPSFNILVNPLYPCIPCEKFATELIPLRIAINEGSKGVSAHPPPNTNTDNPVNAGSNLDFDYEKLFSESPFLGSVLSADETASMSAVTKEFKDFVADPKINCMFEEFVKISEGHDIDCPIDLRNLRYDPDRATEILRENSLVASFLAAVCTIVNERFAFRIVQNFPSLQDLIPNPEEDLSSLSQIFSRDEITMLTEAFLDQYEENGSFDGPLCCTEVNILKIAQAVAKKRKVVCEDAL